MYFIFNYKFFSYFDKKKSLQFVPAMCSIGSKSTLVQVMVWYGPYFVQGSLRPSDAYMRQ